MFTLIQRRNLCKARKKREAWIRDAICPNAEHFDNLEMYVHLLPNSGQVAASNSRNLQPKVPSIHGLLKSLLLARNQHILSS